MSNPQSNLPPRQQEVYEYILQYKKDHGYVPSAVVIAKHYGVASQSVVDTLNALTVKGIIRHKERVLQGTYELCTPRARRK